jgi:hypothetical protein
MSTTIDSAADLSPARAYSASYYEARFKAPVKTAQHTPRDSRAWKLRCVKETESNALVYHPPFHNWNDTVTARLREVFLL